MMKVRLGELRINPLGILSGIFMLLSPFGAWMTLSAFGYVSGSNLLEITNSETSFPIGQNIPSVALYSSILLIIGGLVTLRKARYGLALGTAALTLFGTESFSTFGTFPSAIPVSILPGIGFFLGVCGIILGAAALRTNEISLPAFLSSFTTQFGLGKIGIVITTIFLAGDGWTHWSTGQLSEFLGISLLEGLIHRVFFLGVAVLLLVFVVQESAFIQRAGGTAVLVTFGALVLDAVFHFTTGSIVDFVGHDATEVLLHALTYYGAASVVIARFLLKR